MFIDNIVVFLDSFEDYIQHLHDIFSLFVKKNISISLEKSFLGYLSVELLGFYVDSLGLSTTTECIEAFSKLEFPGILKALEIYLRVAGFLWTIIPYFAKISEPLQLYKTALLAAKRATSKTNTLGKRQVYTRSIAVTKPTLIELKSFKELQVAIC